MKISFAALAFTAAVISPLYVIPAAAHAGTTYQTYGDGMGNYQTYGSDGSSYQTYGDGMGNSQTYGSNGYSAQTYGDGMGNSQTFTNGD